MPLVTEGFCPDCGSQVMHVEGCILCPACGFSACDCASCNGLEKGAENVQSNIE